MVDQYRISLRKLDPVDSGELYQLIQFNETFLTRNGDYLDYIALSEDQHRAGLGDAERPDINFGVRLEEALIGVVTLIHYAPGVFGLGYWMSENFAGRGLTSEAVTLLLSKAQAEYGANEFWAGITPTNQESIDLVKRLGFELARTQESHLSFRLKRAST